MTQEEKSLLLKDLCARLPYDVMVNYDNHIYIVNEIDPACKDIGYITVRVQDVERLTCAQNVMIEDVKPYLRSMSSMTEEEYNEYRNIDNRSYTCPMAYAHIPAQDRIKWLNKNMFDYRGLIEKGLAIKVTEENNPYKE